MRRLGAFYRRLLGLLRRRRLERDLDDELAFHLAMREADHRESGLPPDGARVAARRQFGSVTLLKEQARDTWTFPSFESWLQDVRFAVRTLRRSPAFAVAGVLTLALGIGANTAMFSLVNAVLFRPPSYPDPQRIIVFGTVAFSGTEFFGGSPAKFNVLSEERDAWGSLSAYRFGFITIRGGTGSDEIPYAQVSTHFFSLFGAHPAAGRLFVPEEDRPNAGRFAILSFGLWQRAFGGSDGAIGSTLLLDGVPHTIIGVLENHFDGETLAGPFTGTPAVWVPLQLDPASTDQGNTLEIAARLKRGVTVEAASARLRALAEDFRLKSPGILRPEETFAAKLLQDVLIGDARTPLWLLLGAVGFVLLIACANVASLLLVRGTVRIREIAIRTALGAGRGRVVRQLLTESALLSLAGGLLGLAFGMVAVRWLLALNPGTIPRIGPNAAGVSLDWRVLAFTALVSLATGLLFGSLPALQASRARADVMLRTSGGHSTTRAQSRVRGMLVVAEITLALVLLVGAALLIRTFMALHRQSPGFDPHHVLTMRMALREGRFEKTAGVVQLVEDIMRRVNTVPDVVVSGEGAWVPLQPYLALRFTIVGRPMDGPYHGMGRWNIVSPTYFESLGIPLRRGRLFTDHDTGSSPPVVIVNEAMVRQFWPDEDPLRHQLVIGRDLGPPFDVETARQIVGVVGNVREGMLGRDPQPTTYVPQAQLPDGVTALHARLGFMTWIFRTRGEPHAVSARIEHELRLASGDLPVAPARSMEDILAQSTASTRFAMVVLSVFGGAALLLAATGVYGLMAYSVQQRTHEISIRMALGARRSEVMSLVLGRTAWITSGGIVLGVAAAASVTRYLRGMLFGISPLDPTTFLAVSLMFGSVAMVAAFVPARRATEVDPLVALRSE